MHIKRTAFEAKTIYFVDLNSMAVKSETGKNHVAIKLVLKYKEQLLMGLKKICFGNAANFMLYWV